MYKYNNDTIENLDRVLDFLKIISIGSQINEGEVISMMDNKYGVNKHEAFQLITLLKEKGLVNIHSYTNNSRAVIMRAEGKKFIEDGGFKAEKERYDKEIEEQLKDRKILRELNELNLQKLKGRLENLEKTQKEQSDFWTSTEKRNKAQMYFFVVIAFISIASFIKSFFG